jgi:hypothetical protein
VPFKIELKLNNNSNIKVLQEALLSYLNNNPYVKQLKDAQKKVFLQKLEYIDKEQKSLDSLKYLYNHTLASMKLPTSIYNNGLDMADIYEQSNNLADERSDIIKWLNTQSNALIIMDGLKTPQPLQRPPLIFYLMTGLLAGVILGIVTSILIAAKRSLRDY